LSFSLVMSFILSRCLLTSLFIFLTFINFTLSQLLFALSLVFVLLLLTGSLAFSLPLTLSLLPHYSLLKFLLPSCSKKDGAPGHFLLLIQIFCFFSSTFTLLWSPTSSVAFLMRQLQVYLHHFIQLHFFYFFSRSSFATH